MKIVLCPNPFRDKGLKAAKSSETLLRAAGVHTECCFPFPVDKNNIGEIDPTIKLKEMKTELPDADFLVRWGWYHPPRRQGRQQFWRPPWGGQPGQRGVHG